MLSLLSLGCRSLAPPPPEDETTGALKKLSLEELLDLEVTTVSKRGEKLTSVPSAVQVITSEDIRRSGATTLAEALRLAPNLQVARVGAYDWAITSRGFNGASLGNSLADKLLVMIDGRSIYTPLFAGVFWDVQHVMLENIDHIEVVSGPGGTLWGANAVNGVVNIVTKNAAETQGGLVSIAAGSEVNSIGSARYGGKVGDSLHYRVYGQRIDRDSFELANGADAQDSWAFQQTGVRFDYQHSPKDTLMVRSDYYDGREGDPHDAYVNGVSVLGRWTHTTSEESDWQAQVYYDHTGRSISLGDQLSTFDVDFQHRFPIGARHNLLWGFGYRLMRDEVSSSGSLQFVPPQRELHLASAFVQDEISPIPDRLRVMYGAKIEHNDFTGLEVQPSIRAAWTPDAQQTAWTAISRAVRSPSRLDTDIITTGLRGGGDAFQSENLLAFEAGYRTQPRPDVTLSFAAFHNRYDSLRTFTFNETIPPTEIILANDQDARSTGLEISGATQLREWWRLRGGVSWLTTTFHATNPRVAPGSDAFEARDPGHQLLLQSMMDLPGNAELDIVGRYVAELEASLISPRIPAYVTFDTRVAWRFPQWEVAVIGQNLGAGDHPEFNAPGQWREIPRSVYGRLTFTW